MQASPPGFPNQTPPIYPDINSPAPGVQSQPSRIPAAWLQPGVTITYDAANSNARYATRDTGFF